MKRRIFQNLQKEKSRRCQCLNSKGYPCKREALNIFCDYHQACKGAPLSGSEPNYDPEKYNKDPRIRKRNNCYTYSMNVFDPSHNMQCIGKETCNIHYHQPGGTVGKSYLLQYKEGRTCNTVDKLMRYDVPALRRTTFRKRCPPGSSKIALVVDPGEDYHFFRQDASGTFSHKDGSNPVKQHDANGDPIINPELASRDYRRYGSSLNYEDFCGFYCVPRDKPIRLSP